MFLFFSIPKDIRPFFSEAAKKEGKSKRKFAQEFIYHYYSNKLDQKKRTDYYNKWNRQ